MSVSERKRWTQGEDRVLSHGILNRVPYREIGEQLGRTQKSVAQRAWYIRKSYTNRTPPAQKVKPAPKAEPVEKAEPAPKPPEMPDALLDRVMEAERMVQQIPMLTLIAGAGAMMSFTTLVLVVLALVS
jgi:hypothetical protein